MNRNLDRDRSKNMCTQHDPFQHSTLINAFIQICRISKSTSRPLWSIFPIKLLKKRSEWLNMQMWRYLDFSLIYTCVAIYFRSHQCCIRWSLDGGTRLVARWSPSVHFHGAWWRQWWELQSCILIFMQFDFHFHFLKYILQAATFTLK